MNEIDWKQESSYSVVFNKKQGKLLNNGANPLTNIWLLGVLYIRW